MKVNKSKQSKTIYFLLFVVVLSVLIFACDLFAYKRIFPDAYYDNNFIEHINFDNFVKTSDIPSKNESGDRKPVIGKWDFSYRYERNWDDYEYLSLERANYLGEPAIASNFSTLPNGLNSNSKVFRLEMKNLIVGGDFELTEEELKDFWNDPDNKVSKIGDALTGQRASITIEQNSQVSYLITPRSDFCFTPSLNYELKMLWDSASEAPSGEANKIRVNDSTTPITFNKGVAQTTFFPEEFENESDKNIIKFVVEDGWDLTIDDITIKKIGGQKLRLFLRQEDTKPALMSFLYVFSVWVHQDADVVEHKSPYNLESFELKMLDTDNSSISTVPVVKHDRVLSGWKKIETRVENGNLMFEEGITSPILELVIDLDLANPGTILIAQPELRAYPDGY